MLKTHSFMCALLSTLGQFSTLISGLCHHNIDLVLSHLWLLHTTAKMISWTCKLKSKQHSLSCLLPPQRLTFSLPSKFSHMALPTQLPSHAKNFLAFNPCWNAHLLTFCLANLHSAFKFCSGVWRLLSLHSRLSSISLPPLQYLRRSAIRRVVMYYLVSSVKTTFFHVKDKDCSTSCQSDLSLGLLFLSVLIFFSF